MKKFFLSLLVLFISLSLFAYSGIMSGQKNLKIAKTKYFDIIYAQGSEFSAKVIFDGADELYEELAIKFNLKNKFRLPVVISPAQDNFNAYFSCAPFNHIVMFDTVCSVDIAVFSDEILNTFRHELIHAITYNLRNDFWFGFDKIFGDTWNPALLTVTQGFAEGATVSLESENGEGRLNDEYALQMVKQAKIEGKFPKYSEIQGAMDVFPSGKASYLFGGAFNGWLQKKYGIEKYAEFWFRSVNAKNLTYFGCFKKVYGISIKKAWKMFYEELEVPKIPSLPENIEGIEKVPFKNQLSVYSSLTSNGEKYFYYDEYKRTVNAVQNGKLKVLYKEPNVLRLSASKDGRFLVQSYSSENYFVPKNKLKIYDLAKKSFFTISETSLRDGTIVFFDGNYFLCAVKTLSAFSSLKIYKLNLKKDKISGAELIFEQKFLPEKQIFSLEGNSSGKLFYILKNKLEYSINQFDFETKRTKIYELPENAEKKYVFRNLNWYENTSELRCFGSVSFSYTKKGSLPKLGFLKFSKSDENNEIATFELCAQDVSGGIYEPVAVSEKVSDFDAAGGYFATLRAQAGDRLNHQEIARHSDNMRHSDEGRNLLKSCEKIAFIANFYKGSKIYYADVSKLNFEKIAAISRHSDNMRHSDESQNLQNVSGNADDFDVAQSKDFDVAQSKDFDAAGGYFATLRAQAGDRLNHQVARHSDKSRNLQNVSENFSAFTYNFTGPHGTFIPLSLMQTYKTKNLSTLDSTWLPIGVTYVSSTPWTNPVWYVSAGYSLLSNSGGIEFFTTNNVNALSEFFLYDFTAQVEFNENGYKQSFGNLNLSSKFLTFGANYVKFSNSSTILEGKQSQTEISEENEPESLADYFNVLKTSKNKYLYLNNSGTFSFGNIHKSGFGYYDYSGLQLSATLDNSFFGLTDDLNNHVNFDNISFDFVAKTSFLRPLTLEAILFPNDSYIAAAMANIMIFNWEIQKSTNFLPLFYFNRISFSTYYIAKFANNINSWALFEADKYFSQIKDGDFNYEDELALTCNFEFTPNVGGLARNSFLIDLSCSAKYRFFPSEGQKQFVISAGIGTNFSL